MIEFFGTELIIAGIGVTGIILGGTLQYLFGLRRARSDDFRRLRSEAYVDFVRAIGTIAVFQKNEFDVEARFSAMADLADARARIAIYGGSVVVAKLAGFFRHYGALDSEAAISSFTDVLVEMRRESQHGGNPVNMTDICQLAIGTDVQEKR